MLSMKKCYDKVSMLPETTRMFMHKLTRIISLAAAALAMSLLIIACSKLTQENFSKIKLGMTMQQVTSILGEPTNVEKINIAGISGTSATWQNDEAQIDIQFLNEQVTVKAFSRHKKETPM